MPYQVSYLLPPPTIVSIAVTGNQARFPVHRVYCVGRNYEAHAKEMGFSGREPPFFFMKPADAIVPVDAGMEGSLPYPTLTRNLHHEVELVVAIGLGGSNIRAENALAHVFGYAVGLDMTRRDLQNEMKILSRPWCISKAFDASGPVGAITKADQASNVHTAVIELSVNGIAKQSSNTNRLIWSVAETIEHLSSAWTLQAGDLIFTGTPQGVGAVTRGDVLRGKIEGLEDLNVRIF